MRVTRAIATLCGGLLVIAACVAGAAEPEIDTAQPDTSASQTRKSADLSEIRDRAQSMPSDQRRDIDKRIAATLERVNKDATSKGQAKVAAKLASDFGMTADALLEEKSEHGLSWGELVIAHTLLANATVKIDLLDLASLRSEGLSWGAIAYGLKFHMEDLEDVFKAAGRIGR